MGLPLEQYAPQSSVDELIENAKLLTKPAVETEIRNLLKSAVGLGLSKINRETLFGEIAKRTGLPKSAIRECYSQELHQETGSLGDVSFDIAMKVVEKTFDGGKYIRLSPSGACEEYIGTHWIELEDGKLRGLALQEIQQCGAIDKGGVSGTVNKAVVSIKDILNARDGSSEKPVAGNVVNTLSGELHLKEDGTFIRKPHSPDSNLLACLDIAYDPNAACPLFDQVLLDIFSHSSNPEDMVRHAYEMMGYALQPQKNIPSFFMLYGSGANGKTSFLRTLQMLLPSGAVLNESVKHFMSDNFALASLKGKLLFVDDDISERVKLEDGLIKKISENKEISARRAYGKNKEQFMSSVLIVMAGNSFPRTSDFTDGMRRRTQVIPFNRKFDQDEQDPKLFRKIWSTELPGVLNRALEGLARLRKHGQFRPPQDCLLALGEFMTQATPFMAFIQSECEADPDARTRLKDLREALKAWGKEQGIGHIDGADNTLKRKLEDIGIKVSEIKGYNTAFGLRLAPSPN